VTTRRLRGAKPAGKSVEQPSRCEPFVNLEVTKSIGVTIPQSLMLRADEEVIR
jgi:putative tryptophan/tyrosine transport system substrate-binding protein